MVDPLLTQEEGDALIAMEKVPATKEMFDLPDLGGNVEFPLLSADQREEFVINFRRGRIKLDKRSHNMRGRRVVSLARLDLDGPGHRNPDDVEVGPRHLHLYREGYGLKFAFEIPDGWFRDLNDAFLTLEDFMRYCNVVTLPRFNKGLFS